MKKELIKLIVVSILLAVLFVRCDDDDDIPSYKSELIKNPELLAFLHSRGILDVMEVAEEIKVLDLSGAKLKSLEGLDIFPNLESVNLSNNEFGQSFDFSKLPKSVKRVNLQDNDIYDYLGLIEVNFETAEVKILRTFEEINLPATARYNMEALPFYSKESATTKLTMQNKETKAVEPYTTLREVPDEQIRAFLKNSFSSIMTEEGKIDISKKLSTEQESISLVADMTFYYEPISGPVNIAEAESIEGVEYIINNPFYKGTTVKIKAKVDDEFTMPYFKPGEMLETLSLAQVSTPNVDWSNAKHLRLTYMFKNKAITKVDYSQSEFFMQKENGYSSGQTNMDWIVLYDCPELTAVKFPDIDQPKPIFALELYNLPKLSVLDADKLTGSIILYLAELPALKEMNLSSFVHTIGEKGVLDEEGATVMFSITEDIMKIKGVEDFIVRFGKAGKIEEWSWGDIDHSFSLADYEDPYLDKAYDYTFLYSNETTAKRAVSQNVKNKRTNVDIEEMIRQQLLRERNKK